MAKMSAKGYPMGKNEDSMSYKAKTQQALNEYLSMVVDNFIASLNN